MTTATTPKSETWVDWLEGSDEPDDLYTRDEILSLLKSWRVEADERSLRYWEASGVLPRPVRRRHKGATRAVYPRWYATLVRRVRHLQHESIPLKQIKQRIRTIARYDIGIGSDGDSVDQSIRAFGRVAGPEDLWPNDPLIAELDRLAEMYERVNGVPVATIRVVVLDVESGGADYPRFYAETREPDGQPFK